MSLREAPIQVSTDVCALTDLVPDRGVAALVDGVPVAVFLLSDGSVHVVDHIDPASDTPTLARGMVGSDDDIVFVAAPLHKERYDLRTGACLDRADLSVAVWPAEVVDGRVLVSSPFTAT